MTTKRTLKNHSDLGYINDIPDAPAHFDEELTVIWDDVCGTLLDRFNLTIGDLRQVEIYCLNVMMARRAAEDIMANGIVTLTSTGNTRLNPAVAAQNVAHNHIARIGKTLGLDPQSRAAMTGTGVQATTDAPSGGSF